MSFKEAHTAFKQIHYVELPNGETYAYRKAGNKEKVFILVHGNLGSGAYFSFLVPFLAPYFTIIAPDLRGFGHSTYNKPIKSHTDLADDLKLFVDALNIPKCSIAGISTGGGPIFLFSVKYPEKTDKIILFSSIGPKGAFYPDVTEPPKNKEESVKNSQLCVIAQQNIDNKNKEAFAQIFSGLWGKIEDEDLNTMTEEALMQRNLEDISWANASFNVSNEAGALHIEGDNLASKFTRKALIFAGEDDMYCKLDVQQNWKDVLGEKAVLRKLPGYGHGPRMDQAEETANIFKEFLIS
jgi:pimeloyl-ACP methyl ester carboxylesterase